MSPTTGPKPEPRRACIRGSSFTCIAALATAFLALAGCDCQPRRPPPPPDATVRADAAAAPLPDSASPARADLLAPVAVEQLPVPPLVGKRLAKAQEMIREAGFTIGEIDYGQRKDFDAGLVIAQKPEPRTSLPRGARVDLTINR